MNAGGSVPEPLLPAHIAMQNPHLLDGPSFVVFHQLGLILVLLDHDGDENTSEMRATEEHIMNKVKLVRGGNEKSYK